MVLSKDQRAQAEFNDAFNYLGRINLWFHEANVASSQLDAYRWFHSLQILFRELSTYMKKDEPDKFLTDLNAISDKLKQWHYLSRKKGNYMTGDLYNQLRAFELKLRTVYADSGLQMRKNEGPLGALR